MITTDVNQFFRFMSNAIYGVCGQSLFELDNVDLVNLHRIPDVIHERSASSSIGGFHRPITIGTVLSSKQIHPLTPYMTKLLFGESVKMIKDELYDNIYDESSDLIMDDEIDDLISSYCDCIDPREHFMTFNPSTNTISQSLIDGIVGETTNILEVHDINKPLVRGVI